jgi:hypothetical protein
MKRVLPASGKIQRLAGRHFVGARLVNRRVGRPVIWRHDVVRKHPGFDFLAADVRQHLAVDFNARTHHLAALFDHFLALQRVVDDVAVLKRQVVFAQHGTHAVAPATGRFQIGDDFRFAHKFIKNVYYVGKMPHSGALGKYFAPPKTGRRVLNRLCGILFH